MYVYIAIIVLIAGLCFFEETNQSSSSDTKTIFSIIRNPQQIIISFLLIIFIGLRREVGGDWYTYIIYNESAKGSAFYNSVFSNLGDPGYHVLNWISANYFDSIIFLNVICAILFVCGLSVYCFTQARPFLALLVSFPYLIMVVSLGYVRQSVSISLFMIGILFLARKKYVHYSLTIFFASFFHKSALVLLFYGLSITRIKSRNFLIILAFFAVLLLMYGERAYTLLMLYFESGYSSRGAVFRILPISISGILYILFEERFPVAIENRRFWRMYSYSSVALLIILSVLPSSTAIDRFALYFIPLQVFVLANLPNALSSDKNMQRIVTLAIIAYCLANFIGWIRFADYSYLWLPYNNFLIDYMS